MDFDLDSYFYSLNPSLKKCFKNHAQPEQHDNDCQYCVAVFGLKTKKNIGDNTP